MSPHVRARVVRRGWLLASLVVPAVILAFTETRLLGVRLADRDAGERGLEALASEVDAAFGDLLDRAESTAEGMLRRASLEDVPRGAAGLDPNRLEGYGLLDRAGAWIDWRGGPETPAGALLEHAAPVWRVRVEGLSARLQVLTAPDAAGRRGVVSLVLDAPRPGLTFRDLLPSRSAAQSVRHVDFIEPDHSDEVVAALGPAGRRFREGSPARLLLALKARSGAILALATLEDVGGQRRGETSRSAAVSLAILALVILGALSVRWSALPTGAAGLAAGLGGIAAARGVLAAARVPASLLPRDLSSASVFGRPTAWGLAGSPADLFLTSVAVLLAAATVSRFLRHLAERRRIASVAAGAASAALALLGVHRLAVTLATEARVPLLKLGRLASSWPQVMLLGALLCAILGAASLLAVAVAGMARRESAPRGRRLLSAALLPVALVASSAIVRGGRGLAVERLRSEYVPRVAESTARRRIALAAALESIAQPDRGSDVVSGPPGPPDDFAAYLLWVESDLFLTGQISSLDLHDATGSVRSRFAFGLPPLEETAPVLSTRARPTIREETFLVGVRRQRILHGEAGLIDPGGATVGMAVVHVLDEPENQPFLPWARPYLDALGPGAATVDPGDPPLPEYVLYDRTGAVLLSTLHRPPLASGALWEAAAEARAQRVIAGGVSYDGVAAVAGERLHLLLTPDPGLLSELGAFVRLALLGLVLVAASSFGARLFRHRGLAELIGAFRGSFQGKLLAAMLFASVVPLIGLSLFVIAAVQRRAEAGFADAAAQVVDVVRRTVEDYAVEQSVDARGIPLALNDEILHWLRGVVQQDIHVYENGSLVASTKRELFASGLLPTRLPGEVARDLFAVGLPSVLREGERWSPRTPVAYSRVRLPGPERRTVVAVPLVIQQADAAREIARVTELLLLSTVLLGSLLALVAAAVARTVSRPLRDVVGAAGRVARGDYGARLDARTSDEFAELSRAFNAMAGALAAQRADLERRRDYVEALLRHATTGVISTDAAGRIVTINPAAIRLLETEGNPLSPGDRLEEAVSRSRSMAPMAEVLAAAPPPTGEPREVDLRLSGKPRRLRLVRADLPDPLGGPSGHLWLLDDLTDVMVGHQLTAWAEMARAIAHEIKNPLTPIRLATEHLRRLLADRGAIPPEVEACLGTVLGQVQALREIAAEFSAYSKLPALVPESMDPAQVLREAAAPYLSAPPAGVRIEEDHAPAPRIAVDRRALGRAIVNLVENALQAMPDGGVLRLESGPEPEGSGAVLSVTDTGPGLDPEARSRLFEPYFSTKSSGTGLGLAIARQAVEAHGGRITAEGEPGRGTTFRIHLPAAAP